MYNWKKRRERAAFLALANGAVFRGWSFGAPVDTAGEAVFNTGMSGYQEILTDPSYAGQFVTLTAPEIGNYGCNPQDVESRGLFLNGLVIHELNEPSNCRSEESLSGTSVRLPQARHPESLPVRRLCRSCAARIHRPLLLRGTAVPARL